MNTEAIRKYIQKGWSVFPVQLTYTNGKYEKRPAVSWKQYQTTRPTEEDLKAWEQLEFNAIGLATGKISQIVVVDVDSKEIPEGIDSPMIVNTISGGKHFYYKYSEELRNTTRIEGMPVDFRGDGGFVVLPPSACNGSKYEWATGKFDPMFLPTLPKEIEKKLKADKVQTPISQPLEQWPTPEQGNRNDTAIKIAGQIVNAVNPKQRELIGWPRFQQWNNALPQPLPEDELRRTWDSANMMDNRNHPQTTFKTYTGSDSRTEYNRLFKNLGDGLTTGIDEIDNYFKFLPQQLYLISGQTHLGKTTFALNMAAMIASLGHKVNFFSLEQGVFIAPRVETILGGSIPPTLTITTTDELASIKEIKEYIQTQEKTELLILDHIHFIRKDTKGATEALDDNIMELQNLAKSLEIPIIAICHVRKLNQDKAPELDDLRDSSSLSQVPSVVMLLYRKRNDPNAMDYSYLSDSGLLFIAKNRIQGKTGVLPFKLQPSGLFDFGSKKKIVSNREIEDIFSK